MQRASSIGIVFFAASLSLAGCAPSDPADLADDDADDAAEHDADAVQVWSGLGLMGVHDPALGGELLDLFPSGGGWTINTVYSTDFDWAGTYGSGTTWARQHGFHPVIRVDYARPEHSTFADGTKTNGATIPPPGDVGYCLAREDGGPSRNVGGRHLDCYLAFLDDLVGATPDVHTWIVGNEMNMSLEALGFPGGRIDPSHYANVFRAARARIRSKPGHGDDAVFVGAVAPGVAGDGRYESGKEYLGALLYQLAPNDVDGISIHAYGGWPKPCDNGNVTPLAAFESGAFGGLGYRTTAQWIDALGFSRTPLLITEMSAHLHIGHGAPNPACGAIDDGFLYDKKELSDFIRAAYQSINQWNGGPTNHDILGGVWFSYDNGGYPEESLKTMRDVIAGENQGTSSSDNPYYAFRDLAKNGGLGHGDPSGYGTCARSDEGTPLSPDGAPYSLKGKLRQFWSQSGGLPVFGYPIENADCRADDTGRVLWSQYTQRSRLEYHPELAGTAYEVSLGLLGRAVAKQNGFNPDAWSNTGAPHASDCSFVGANASTGHYVCGRIRDHFNSHGVVDPGLSAFDRSVRLFGLPITEPVTFQGRTVQWFERARLELHPENDAPYDVLGGLLGCEASGIHGWGC